MILVESSDKKKIKDIQNIEVSLLYINLDSTQLIGLKYHKFYGYNNYCKKFRWF